MQKNNPPIKVIIFDFGDVLVADTQKKFEKYFGINRLGKQKKEIYETISKSAETGKVSNHTWLQTMKNLLNADATGSAQDPADVAQIEKIMIDSSLIKPMWKLFKSFSKDYALAIFSNNHKPWPAQQAKRLGISLKGIRFYNSAELGARKPERKAFKIVLKDLNKAFGAKPEQIIFVDDRPKNVKAARQLRIKAIRFTGNVAPLLQNLKKSGVKVRINAERLGM